jgi:hypothetical protein
MEDELLELSSINRQKERDREGLGFVRERERERERDGYDWKLQKDID